MSGKRKKINKEEIAEDWCFVCKDGGDVRICDYKQCLKSYHSTCVAKSSESRFVCPRHACLYCKRGSVLYCYTCPYSLCRHCIDDTVAKEFTRVKGEHGFCNICLKLVLLVEEGMDCDSDGERVDFTDRNSVEGLFLEYYEIVKKAQGIELNDILDAQNKLKAKKDSDPGYSSEEFYVSEEDEVSDYDDCAESQKSRRKPQSGKKSKGQSSSKTHLKSSKMEFIGWGSKPLIDFLSLIGKSNTEKISQRDVTSIVEEYIKENKLFDNSQKRKRRFVNSDEILQSLFKKKVINKLRIHDLLEIHFAENHDDLEEETLESDSDTSNLRISRSRSKKKLDVEKKCQKKELQSGASNTGFASIAVENIKLVYLRRSLIFELVKERESFEEKVIGSFVRVKTNPYDYTTTSSHQLMQVKGVKPAPEGEINGEIVLLFPTMHGESQISLLSDDNFSEAECEELKQKILAGLLERPTMVKLEQKAKALHKDITEHWIIKELSLLKKRIDRANEKGWRREFATLAAYLEERKKLQSPSEQKRLIDTVPKVIPETKADPESVPDENSDKEIDEDSAKSEQKRLIDTVPKVIPETKADPESVPSDNSDMEIDEDSAKLDETTHHVPSSPPEKQTTATTHFVHGNKFNKPLHHCSSEEKDKKQQSNGSEEKAKLSSPKRMKSQDTPPSTIDVIDLVCDGKKRNKSQDPPSTNGVIDLVTDGQRRTRSQNPPSTNSVIDLVSDGEDDASEKFDGTSKWCILGPRGERHECYLSVLKRWSKFASYAFEFKVWRVDEEEEDAIPLGEAIRMLPD